MSVSRVLSLADIQTVPERTDVRRIRLKLLNDGETVQREQAKSRPVGRAYAVVASRESGDSSWDGEALKTHSLYNPDLISMVTEAQSSHELSLTHLRTELRHIKEVRHSMESVRQQLHGHINRLRQEADSGTVRAQAVSGQRAETGLDADGNRQWVYRSENTGTQTDHDDGGGDETEKMRQVTRRLYIKLQEAERAQEHQRKALEDRIFEQKRELGEARESLRGSEERVADRDRRIEELQRLMSGMEEEHRVLAGRMTENERQLEEMRAQNRAGKTDQHRVLQLEKEAENLREKICHLNDMLKSQQRKVRQMIEQMQSSRTQIEEKDLLIQQLQERVEHLESENREMQDRLEYVTSHKVSSSVTSQRYNGRASTDPQVISRHPVGCRKPKALVRVLETS